MNRNSDGGCGLIFYAVFSLIYVVVANWSVAYLIELFHLNTISTLGTCTIGFFVGSLSIPLAIAIFLLKAFGGM